MISVNRTPAAADSSAPSTAATPTAAPASAFDAILTLESLTATCAALGDPLNGGALEASCLDGLEEGGAADGDDRDDRDDAVDEEGPLAFLASLLNLNVPTPAAPA